MRKICLIALSMLCFILLVSCKGNSNDLAIVFSENGVVTKEIATEVAGTLSVPAPAGTRARYCIGWQCINEGQTIFLPVGASYAYEVGESKDFTPVYFHFTTSPDASLDTTVSGGGISFSAEINKADWTGLMAITENVSCGILIAKTADASQLEDFTHKAMTNAQMTPSADIVSTAWQAESEDTLTFGATLGDIADSDLATPYTAIGYIKITYTNGESVYTYAPYTDKGAPTCALISFPEVVKERLDFTTLSSARLDLDTKGITFSSAIDREDWVLLSSLAKSISCGTLIYPAAGLGELGGSLTHASLSAAQKWAIDIPSSTWLPGTAQELCFGATLSDSAPYHRSVAYTAAGYVRITYNDDSVIYVYAAPEGGTASEHSVFSLARAAKDDLSDTQTDLYQYPVGELFSPYTDTERAVLDELSNSRVDILFNYTSAPGKYILDSAHQGFFSSQVIREIDKDPESVAKWREILRELTRAFGHPYYMGGGALIVTAKDGTPLTADNLTEVILKNGTTEFPGFTEYIFYKGALIVPYMTFTPPI